MKLLTLVSTLLLVLSTLFPITVSASDLAKEKRWAEQIEDDLLDGESVTLNDGKIDFYSIYTKAEEPKDTAIILLHGLGVHPDWPQVINPLRVALPEQGWSTISLQLPVLENEAPGKDYLPLYKDVPARLKAGIKHLQDDGVKKIIIVAHSLGAEMATYSLAESSDEISGFVGIGMGPDNIEFLPKVKLPVLDLYGENDLPDVIASAGKREKSASDNKHYKQQRVASADHFFDGFEKQLIESVVAWLEAQK